jgi:transposase
VTLTMLDMASARAGQDGGVAAGKGPQPGRAKRRTFTAEYKLRIVAEYEQLDDPGARGALLRRQGHGKVVE